MSVRLAIGPANFAGQADAWARAVRSHTVADARSFAYGRRLGGGSNTGYFDFAVNTVLPHPRVPYLPMRAFWIRRALSDATHVALDGYLSLRGSDVLSGLEADLQWLSKRGGRTALIAHGSDVRDPDRHMANIPDSYYSHAPEPWVAGFRERSRRNRAIAVRSGLPLFVSTPDLLNDLPQAHWLPLVVARAAFGREKPAASRPLRILHIPSRSEPPIKGSKMIMPVLEDLEARGAIIWIRGSSVPHHKMLTMMQSADVVIDQMGTGSYGVTTIEAMAAGAAVVGSVHQTTLAKMPEAPPIIQTDFPTLRQQICELATNPRIIATYAQKGSRFVQKWHDGRYSAAVLSRFLGVPPPC